MHHKVTALTNDANNAPGPWNGVDRDPHFTPRESEILSLIALEGLSDKEVAARLGLSSKTVSSYLSRVFVRHRLQNRTQAAVTWLIRGAAGSKTK